MPNLSCSPGSFHLLRTLFDSYLAYLVEQRLASHEIRMTYVGDSNTHSTSQSPMPPPLSSSGFPVHHPEMGENGSGGSGAQLEGMYPKYPQVHPHHHEAPSAAAPPQNRSTGKHYMPFMPPEAIERPAKQIRMDPQVTSQPSQPSAQPPSRPQQPLPSPPNPPPQSVPPALLPSQSSDLMKPPHPPLPPHSTYPPIGDR